MSRRPEKPSPASVPPLEPERRASGDRVWSLLGRSVRPLDGAQQSQLASAVFKRREHMATTAPTPLIVAPQRRDNPAPPGPLNDRGGERRVRRGKLEIGAKLDLHGYTQDKAEAALRRFLVAAREDGCLVVLVVTGKGGRLVSGEVAPGVLKRRLPEWLEKVDLRPMVSGYAEAHQRHGGGGAFYVFLKRSC
jgi:DNA-nicking Smr family endonuclease